jgi:transposase InsO family protein
MLIHLHSQATTTPRVRAAIQASDQAGTVLADRFGVTAQTIYKWRKRDTVEDRSHTPHRLQTTLTPAQEAVAVALRKTLLVSLDDLLAVVREFLNPNVSRSGLDRCLRRHGVGNLRDLQARAAQPRHSGFKAYEPGYLHIDVKYLPQMADETSRRYLFVAIDRATRWVFIRIFKAKTAANARRFLRDLERACPIHIRTVLADNGKEFTDRLFGLRKRAATGAHEFDKLCADLDIEHRLTPPKSPQTNGMVERFNGRIEEVLQSHHFRSGEELETTLHRYVRLYNQQLPQSALGSKSPLQAMKDWYKLKPQLFRKQPYHLPGCDMQYKSIIAGVLISFCAGSAVAQGQCSVVEDRWNELNGRILDLELDYPFTVSYVCGSAEGCASNVDSGIEAEFMCLGTAYVGCAVLFGGESCNYVIGELGSIGQAASTLREAANSAGCSGLELRDPC